MSSLLKARSMTPRELVKRLEREGFAVTRQSGSHAIFKHPVSKRRVVGSIRAT